MHLIFMIVRIFVIDNGDTIWGPFKSSFLLYGEGVAEFYCLSTSANISFIYSFLFSE